MRTPHAFLLSLALGFLGPFPVQAKTPLPLPKLGVEESSLSETVDFDLTGLQFESENLEIYQKQAQAFLRFRRGKVSPVEKLLWVADCLAKPLENVFCAFLAEPQNGRAPAAIKSARLSTRQEKQILKIFRKKKNLTPSDFAPFGPPVSETDVHRALKSFSSWEEIRPFAEFTAKEQGCAPLPLLVALGLKAEEFFPDPPFRTMARSFYAKAIQCYEGKEEIPKPYFRLSLLSIWEGKCNDAAPTLEKLIQVRQNEFAPRALYWRAFCAREGKDTDLAKKIQQRLLEDYPLSFHALVSGQGGVPPAALLEKFLQKENSPVRFRSKTNLEVNDYVRAIEIFQAMGQTELALELLRPLEKKLERTEASFRLYVALLYRRSGAILDSFRILSEAFQIDPTLISRLSLELFYPLWRFEVVQEGSELKQMNPYFVAAVIRQESGFNTRARSPAGALGLMQILPKTARRFEKVKRRTLFDAKTNIRIGVKYFNHLLTRYKGDAELALAAYNAGEERIDDWLRRYPVQERLLFLDLLPFRETRDYVALITRNFYWYQKLYSEAPPKENPFGLSFFFLSIRPLSPS